MTSILAQHSALRTLQGVLRQRRVPHAWIFHGPFGVGKFTAAVEFARLLLDPTTTDADIERFEAPRSGPDAELFEAGSHPDLHVIRREMAAASRIASLRRRKLTSIPLDLIRERIIGGRVEEVVLDAPVARSSVRGHGKVFIVDEAELLEPVAQDALLKTLEEPVARTWIILVTTREHFMRPTVRSRSQRAAFVPLDQASMQAWAASRRDLPEGEARRWLLGDASADPASRGFADGSPGTALFASRHGLHEWQAGLSSFVEDSLLGRFQPSAADAMFRMIDELAKALVKERSEALRGLGPIIEDAAGDEDDEEDDGGATTPGAPSGPKGEASVAAAKRDAAQWLFAVLGHEVHRRIRLQARQHASGVEGLATALRLLDLIPQAARQLDDNVNLRNVLSDLAALAAAPRLATLPFGGLRAAG